MAVPPGTFDSANQWAPPPRAPQGGDGSAAGYAAAPGYVPPVATHSTYGAGPMATRLRGLGIAAATLLWLQVLLGLATTGVAAWGVLNWSKRSGGTADMQLSSDQIAFWLMLLSVPLTLLTGILFISWLYVAAANAERNGAQLRHSPLWAIFGWFIPILSLWRPKQVVDDVWRASVPGIPAGADLRRIPKSGLVTGWWACWLVAGVLPSIGISRAVWSALSPNIDSILAGEPMATPFDPARFRETIALWTMWSSALLVVAAFLLANVVMRVTSWQDTARG